jgi:hypothetical protein
MSTQRRENRWQRRSCTKRAGSLASLTQNGRAIANGGTAPLLSIVWLAFAWLATDSLQSDHRIGQLVRQDVRRGWPPYWVGRRAATGTPAASTRSSSPHIPTLPERALLHRSLPQAPEGRRLWAERYDGKRDLYIQHAA